MKKIASILINRETKPITVYPVHIQGDVAGKVESAPTVRAAWDIAFTMSDQYNGCAIDFADNYDLARN